MGNIDQAEALFQAAFSDTTREPRSPEYKQGVKAALLFRCAGVKSDVPFPAGTAQCDAWLAGHEEGKFIYRSLTGISPQEGSNCGNHQDRTGGTTGEH